ncbi:hypothetical protein SFC66_06405 [Terribacillus saccharophilus]|uniref:hypothetical protein n=1 Tax=Terribacillus saccharophilus TaxID=361277 RepID=UPI0039819C40
MTIKITRKTGMMGYATKVKLFADGKEITKLSSGETYYLDIDKDTVELRVQQFTSKGKPITVKDHSHLTLQTNPMLNYLFIAMIVLIFMGALTSYFVTILALIPAIAALIVSLNNSFHIAVDNQPNKNDVLAGER